MIHWSSTRATPPDVAGGPEGQAYRVLCDLVLSVISTAATRPTFASALVAEAPARGVVRLQLDVGEQAADVQPAYFDNHGVAKQLRRERARMRELACTHTRTPPHETVHTRARART